MREREIDLGKERSSKERRSLCFLNFERLFLDHALSLKERNKNGRIMEKMDKYSTQYVFKEV